MDKVTSAEIQAKFGRIRAKALQEAVIITHHGRDDLALISADEYRRLRSLDQQAFYPHELDDDVLEGMLSEPIPEEACQFEDEYKP